jgi:hypothetical protein
LALASGTPEIKKAAKPARNVAVMTALTDATVVVSGALNDLNI